MNSYEGQVKACSFFWRSERKGRPFSFKNGTEGIPLPLVTLFSFLKEKIIKLKFFHKLKKNE